MYRKLILLLAIISAATFQSVAFPASTYATSSKLASGKWVKIKVTNEGIYQLSYEALKEMGFDNPSDVYVYGFGGVSLSALNHKFDKDFPDDIRAVPTHHTSDGRIIFYAQGDAHFRSANLVGDSNSFTTFRNVYDTASFYFLSDRKEAKDEIPANSKIEANEYYETLAEHIHIDYIEEETQTASSGGANYNGPSHTPGSSVTYTFSVKDFVPTTSASGSFFYQYAVHNPNSSVVMSSAVVEGPVGLTSKNVTASKISDGLITFRNLSGYTEFKSADEENPVSGDFTFRVDIPNVSVNYCAEDFLVLRYLRANRLDSESPFLIMNMPEGRKYAGQKVELDVANPAGAVVWNIDGPEPKPFATDYDADSASASFVLDGASSTFVSFCPAFSFPEPEVVDVAVDNQDIHSMPVPDMIIVTIADQLDQARDLADIHKQYQGLDVLVVDQEKVFNEFSSGTHHSMGIRRMAKMFYDRGIDENSRQSKLRHLLLLGPTYFDNRSLLTEKIDRVLNFQTDDPSVVNNSILSYASDQYFGMLNDNYNHADIHISPVLINVGRVPSINPGQAATYVNKVRSRFENTQPSYVYNHAIVIGGSGDGAEHSRQAKVATDYIRNEFNPLMQFTQAHAEVFAKENFKIHYNSISAALNRGAGYMLYIGHGSPTSIDTWGISEVNSTHYTHSPFVMFASCDQFAFDHTSTGLVHTMLFTENGGAIGGVAAVRSVYIQQNQKTAVPVSVAYASSKPGDTFGDIFRRSREMLIEDYKANPSKYSQYSQKTIFRNVLAYNLAGDPAIPVGVPEFTADITDILVGDESVTDNTIKPFELVTFKGKITKDDKIVTDFNGSVRIDIYDGAHQAATISYNNEPDYVPNVLTMDNDVLATIYGTVENGLFEVESSVPLPAFPTGIYRTIISAESDNGNAIGLFSGLNIGDFNPDESGDEINDTPSIDALYADNPTFRPGNEVSALTTVYAIVNPSDVGLNTMTGNINSRTRITVDGTSSSTDIEGFFTRRDDGRFDLAVPLKELSEGLHVIELFVASTTGKFARSSIEVLATHRTLEPGITVEETPATEYATIDIENSVSYSRLSITDASGNEIFFDNKPSFPYRWELKDNTGKDVPDGLYRVSVLVNEGQDYGSTSSANITVLR